MNQLLMKKYYDSRVESLHLTPIPIDVIQTFLTHSSALCPPLTSQRYLDSIQHMILKIATLERTGLFLIIAILC